MIDLVLFFRLTRVAASCIHSYCTESDDIDDDSITCGSVVKVMHQDSEYLLHSEEKALKSGSGQQIVTFVHDPATHHSLWTIRPADHSEHGEYPLGKASCQLAEPVKCGSYVRLTHLETQKNLHSHNVKSILSSQQEVSAFGSGDGRGDGGDNWRVDCLESSGRPITSDGKRVLKRGLPFRLYHRDTGKYLGSSKNLEFNVNTCGRNCPIMDHLESFCRKGADNFSVLKISQGIHISK